MSSQMLLSEGMSKKKEIFAGLPQVSEVDKSTYLQLAGRILLVALFFSFLLAGDMTWCMLACRLWFWCCSSHVSCVT